MITQPRSNYLQATDTAGNLVGYAHAAPGFTAGGPGALWDVYRRGADVHAPGYADHLVAAGVPIVEARKALHRLTPSPPPNPAGGRHREPRQGLTPAHPLPGRTDGIAW